MELVGDIQWGEMLLPDTPLLEIFVRGTIMYLGILALLRFVGRREVGMVALPDILMIVLLADAAQNGMADDYHSVADGLFLVLVIILWNVVIDRLTFHFQSMRRLVHPPPLKLVSEGRLLRANLRREYISNEELWERLRAAGVSELSQVKMAYLESTGEISVVRNDGEQPPEERKKPV